MAGKLGVLALFVLAVATAWTWHSGARAPLHTASTGSCIAVPPAAPDDMVWIPAGNFTMGADYTYQEEGPAHAAAVAGFWMDRTEVTNRQFETFVTATGYRTLAERGLTDPAHPDTAAVPGSAVFVAPGANPSDLLAGWWQFRAGADWRHPEGPGSDLRGRETHPVVHVAFEDAQAYAAWKGHSLPTEAQFEYAAQDSGRRDAAGTHAANTWQGIFPFSNDALDGHAGTAPAGCFAANRFGLHDLIGNVWEWTASPYYPGHDFSDAAAYPEGLDPLQPGEAVAVIKGGSWLCAPNYCMRYRPQARQGQSKGLGTSHIGFRTVRNP